MTIQAQLLPLFVEVLLTFGLVIWLAVLRSRDLGSRTVQMRDIALREPAWSPRTLQIGYCFSNQFELPVLFYVLTILSIYTHHADLIFVVLAWVFVVFRLLHAYVHTTTNHVRHRGMLWGVAALALFIAWIIFIVRILAGLP